VEPNIGQFIYDNGVAVVKFTRVVEEEFNLSQLARMAF
jgi:hypothetical protein